MARLFADLPRGGVATPASSPQRLDFTLADLGYRFPDYPLPPGETPASYLRQLTWNARARPLPAAHRARPGADREGAGADREARPRRLLPDRLGHRRVLPARADPLPGARLGGEQRGLLRARHHRRRPGEDGAPLRALPLRGARRVARHRPRPALRRPAREGRSSTSTGATARRGGGPRRGDDRQRHHLPRPLGGARGGEGARLLAPSRSTGSPSSSAPSATTSSAATRSSSTRELAAAGFDPERAAQPPLRRAAGARSRTCRATSASTRAAW